MSGEPTLRAHLRDIGEEAETMRARLSLAWLESDRDSVKRIVGHAVAALALLDETSAYAAGTYDVVFTEEGDRYPTRFRLVPDPVVSSIATRD